MSAPSTVSARRRVKVERLPVPPGLAGLATNAADLVSEARTPVVFVVDRLAAAGDVVLLTGIEKESFKTMLACELTIARILGTSWLGFDVTPARTGNVLMISTETRGSVLVRRLLALLVGRGHSEPERILEHVTIIDRPVTLISRDERIRIHDKRFVDTKARAAAIYDRERRATVRADAAAVAKQEVNALGQNLDALTEIEDAPEGTWSLIVVDTLRQCLSGDENSSEDAARFIAAARDLARRAGCPIVVIHHTGKGTSGGTARNARGSGELTAGPDALITIDVGGEHPTAHFQLRNYEPVEPVGYRFDVVGEGLRLAVLAASTCATKSTVGAEEVLDVFRLYPDDGLTATFVRAAVAAARGAAPGSKATPKTVERHLGSLVTSRAISKCTIAGRDSEIEGYRLGPIGGTVKGRKIEIRERGEDPFTDFETEAGRS